MMYKFQNKSTSLYAEELHYLSPLPHIHSHLELVYLTEGASVANIDGKEFLLEKGSFFFSFPNQIHYYHDRTPVKGYIFIFSPEFYKELREVFRTKVPVSPIIKVTCPRKETAQTLGIILAKHNSEAYFDRISAKGSLLSVLGELLSFTKLVDASADYDSVKNVLMYCSENYTEPLSLDLLSKKLHLSRYYISHIFSDKLQVSFTEFLNTLRLEHACVLLEKGTNITEVALASGFSSVRTFNRVFMEQMKMTPREYIKRR